MTMFQFFHKGHKQSNTRTVQENVLGSNPTNVLGSNPPTISKEPVTYTEVCKPQSWNEQVKLNRTQIGN